MPLFFTRNCHLREIGVTNASESLSLGPWGAQTLRCGTDRGTSFRISRQLTKMNSGLASATAFPAARVVLHDFVFARPPDLRKDKVHIH